mmetsp:Transcript_30253/g.66108  ORF Transcript_30253/g.66108 Transcript_30253/m.66108 type:complete len:87 (-) Transcript_30253:147-407(-)
MSVKKSATTLLYKVSPALRKVINADEATRPAVVKGVWNYIKENNLQDPKVKGVIVNDASMQAVFGKTSMKNTDIFGGIGKHMEKSA